ncbi:PREDICTED: pentatricopeptide repeat-containing protein At5g03800 [Nelumbo nucifera]|uniref:DYW domain-containing protein n=2 Tax=Nelumbo nucifera TaxID=4432 RepID=A0A822YC61_NELNU|nr:PREDICTED: pentatricopeptide repeat-containing protein At5g03800 [Nelumbo nucifera]DAD28656.1 TPA_asm: hypothetical protein HUJ06_030124 [Nelumbo nucifera]
MAPVIHSTFLSSSFPQSLLFSHSSTQKPSFDRYKSFPFRPTTAITVSYLPLTPSEVPFSTSPAKFLTRPQQLQLHNSSQALGSSVSADDDAVSLPDRNHQLLRLSIRHGDIELASAVHASIVKAEEDVHLSNSLIAAYLKLDRITDAQKTFACLSSPDVVSYSALVSAYAKSKQEDKAIELFFKMRGSGIEPNEFSFVAILTACIRLSDLQLGYQIHSLAIKTGYSYCVYVSNALMGVYIRSECINHAYQLFGEMAERDVSSWNTIISAAVKELQYERAFDLFRDMQQIDQLRVDSFTLSSLLAASTGSLARMEGQKIHAHALKIGLQSNVSVNNSLIGFYTKCGSIEDVVAVFEKMPVKDIISWTGMITGYMEFGFIKSALNIFDSMPERNYISYNAMLAGYCQNGEGSKALELFRGMVEEGMDISDFTLTSAVNACSILSEMETSKQIHGFVIKSGFGSNSWIEAALLDMCTKCARMDDAQKMFTQWSYNEEISVVWTSMICGYARNGQLIEALNLFYTMQVEDMIVDEVASTAVLGVCGSLGFHEMGIQIHAYVLKSGFVSDIGLGSAIFSMYSKCGNIDDAIKSFNVMPKHDMASWNGLIAGHLLHRKGDEALSIWSKMEKIGIKPDSFTLVLILSAYRYTRSNCVDKCHSLFLSMRSLYGIEPTPEHYASMVDVFGYWGYFKEAEELINNMPHESDGSAAWRALLDSCRLWLNASLGRSDGKHLSDMGPRDPSMYILVSNLGRLAAKHLLAIEPQDPSMYILVSNLYSASGRWHCAERVREEMREKGLQKIPGRSWYIHQNKVYSFYARDKSYSQSKDIYSGLEILILECLKVGYVPDTSFVLHEVEEHQKKDFLFYHSAKLAVTYGLLMTKHGRPIRVTKNISLCGDCHTFFKYVSTVTGREISLRDASGFHNFKNGECSCRDYW